MTGLIPRSNFSLIDSLFDDWQSKRISFTPALDVEDREAAYVITADLPGVRVEDLDISFHQGRLTISGARKVIRSSKSTHQERAEGSFSRTFSIPKGGNIEDIDASMSDGVLTVSIPKTPEVKPRQIPIKVL